MKCPHGLLRNQLTCLDRHLYLSQYGRIRLVTLQAKRQHGKVVTRKNDYLMKEEKKEFPFKIREHVPCAEHILLRFSKRRTIFHVPKK